MARDLRTQTIDGARGLAMVLVVFAHALQIFTNPNAMQPFNPAAFEIWRVFASFVVSAFFFVSGLGAVRLGTKPPQAAISTAISLILLADITQLAFAPFQAGVSLARGDAVFATVRHIVKPLVFGTEYNLGIPWFLVALAFVEMIAIMIVRARPMGKAAIWAGLVGLYVLCQVTHITYYQAQVWVSGVAFYMLGSEFGKRGLLDRPYPQWSIWAVAAVSTAALILTAPLNHGCLLDPVRICRWPELIHGFGVNEYTGHQGFLPLFALTAIIGIIAATAFLMLARTTALMRPLVMVGHNTLVLVVLNGFVLNFVQPFIPRAFDVGAVPPLGVVILSLAATAAQVALVPAGKPALMKMHYVVGLVKPKLLGAAMAVIRGLKRQPHDASP